MEIFSVAKINQVFLKVTSTLILFKTHYFYSLVIFYNSQITRVIFYLKNLFLVYNYKIQICCEPMIVQLNDKTFHNPVRYIGSFPHPGTH